MKIRVEGTVEGSSFASLLFPRFYPPFTFASYRNNFFSQYRSHATMPMPTGLPVVTLGTFWGSSIDTNTWVGLSNVKSWWCCAVTSDLLPWTECPSRIFPQSHNPNVYFQHPASCAYFRSRISPPFSFEIPNPGPGMKQIPDPEQPIGDPRKACAQAYLTRARAPSTSHLTRRRVQAIDELHEDLVYYF